LTNKNERNVLKHASLVQVQFIGGDASIKDTWHITACTWRHKLICFSLSVKDNVTCCRCLNIISSKLINALTTDLSNTAATMHIRTTVLGTAEENLANCATLFVACTFQIHECRRAQGEHVREVFYMGRSSSRVS
jgi:hypothetical protein